MELGHIDDVVDLDIAKAITDLKVPVVRLARATNNSFHHKDGNVIKLVIRNP